MKIIMNEIINMKIENERREINKRRLIKLWNEKKRKIIEWRKRKRKMMKI